MLSDQPYMLMSILGLMLLTSFQICNLMIGRAIGTFLVVYGITALSRLLMVVIAVLLGGQGEVLVSIFFAITIEVTLLTLRSRADMKKQQRVMKNPVEVALV